MSRYSITVFTTTLGEWEEGADERPVLDRDSEVIEFDHLTEVAEYLSREGLDSPSVQGFEYNLNTWVGLADGTRPTSQGNYMGEVVEMSAHPDVYGGGFTVREWAAVLSHLVKA